MLARRVIGGLALLISLAGPFAAAAANDPPGATSCSGCHAASAAVETPVPRLVGRPALEIVAAMSDFRTGLRPATVMDRIAKGFSVDETGRSRPGTLSKNSDTAEMSKQQPTRRTFLTRAAGAACSAGAFHPALAQRAARRVVAIGGGFAGATCAAP